MRPDLYTKAVLTVIAPMLAMIACNQFVSWREFFDSRSGDVWVYNADGTLAKHLKVTKLGQPLQK